MLIIGRRPRAEKRNFINNMLVGAMSAKPVYSIANSLLFRGGQYLSRTPSVAGDQQKFTIMWEGRRGDLGRQQYIVSAKYAGASTDSLNFQAGDQLHFMLNDAANASCITSAVFRDPTAWYQVVVAVDTTQPVAADRIKMWVNGNLQAFTSPTYPAQNYTCAFNRTNIHYVGAHAAGPSSYFNGYTGEYIVVDGSALTPSSFGETDPVTGSWRPKIPYVSSWGTNGSYLGKPWNSAALGTDYSGNGNTWTANGFDASDVVRDSPTNVYATLNLLNPVGAASLSNGNMTVTTANSGTLSKPSTLAMSSGVYVWEVKPTASTTGEYVIGIIADGYTADNNNNAYTYMWYSYAAGPSSKLLHGGSRLDYTGSSAFTANDIVGVKLDLTAGTLTFYKNGVSQGVAFTGLSGTFYAIAADDTSSSGATLEFNFGQRTFSYPNAYGEAKTLCTSELPTTTTGQTSGSFTGNGSADGPYVYTGAVPETLTINGNAVTWGTHADKLATGFKLRTTNTSYNSTGTNTWAATYNKKPTVGVKHIPANAQGNP